MTAAAPAAATATALRHRKIAAWAFLALSVVLIVGWPIAAIIDWDDIVDSHTRLGYLIGDWLLVVPLGIAVFVGVRRHRRWTSPILLLAIGATAYDAVHFFIYLAQERFLSIPAGVYVAILIASLGALLWFAVREIGALRG